MLQVVRTPSGGTRRSRRAERLLLITLLGGCSDPNSDAPSTAPATPTPTQTVAKGIPESKYFAVVRADVPTFKNLSDGELRAGGKDVCTLMGQDHSDPWAWTLAELTKDGLEATEAGAFIAASVAEYCPAHLVDLPR